MRKRVSANLRIGRFFFVPWLVIILVTDVAILISDFENITFEAVTITLGVSALLISVGYLLYRYLDNAQNVEFDGEYFYVSDKFGVQSHAMSDIVSFTMTTTHFNDRYAWKLEYHDNDGKSYSTFFPRLFYQHMDEFRTAIQSANEAAKVQELFKGPFVIEKSKN